MDKNYKEIGWVGNIEQAVNELLEYKSNGKLAYCNFNGVNLYSDTVTIDGAYKQITGKTKAERDKEHEEWVIKYNEKENEHKKMIPELSIQWIKRGKEVLTEDKWDYWTEIVPIRLGDLYHGMELGCCLDIVEILNAGEPLEVAKKKIEGQSHSGMSFSLVCAMVGEFCVRGKEFMDYVK